MSPHPPQDVVDTTDGHPVVFSEPAVGHPLRQGEDVTACSQKTSAMVALTMLSVAYIFNILIMVDVVYETLYMPGYNTKILLHLWDGLLVGQFIGQVAFGMLCDSIGQIFALYVSMALVVLGSVLCTASRGVQGNTSGLMWFGTIARGIVGVGIGGTYPTASTTAFDIINEKTAHSGRAFVMMTNFVFNAGGMLATIVFVIVLAAAQPGHLDTVWPVCIGIGIVIPLAAICYSTPRTTSRRLRSRAMKYLSMYSSEAKQHWVAMVRTACLWFVYDFVVYPKLVFSGGILLTLVDGDIWRTAGYRLLLVVFALSGSLAGAMVCDTIGRRNLILVSFVGYVIFALIIGCAYDRLLNVTPLLVVLYALMLFMGNLGPGNLLSLIASESYPSNVRGSFYGVTAAFGTAGAIAGIHAFATIDDNLRKQWGFIIAALCGVVGIVIAYFLPSSPDILPADLSEKDTQRDADVEYVSEPDTTHPTPIQDNTSAISYADKDADLNDGNGIAVPVVKGANGLESESIMDEQDFPSTTRVLLLERMSALDVSLVTTAPALDVQEAHEVIAEYVAESHLQKFFKEDDAFVKTVEGNASRLQDDGRSFPITRQNVERLIRLSLYRPVIYCDDSGSMTLDEPSRWDLLRDAVARIASITTRALPHPYGVDLRFINALLQAQDNIPAANVLNVLNRMEPNGGTALGATLRNHILKPLVYDILGSQIHSRRLLERPLLICVITDGCPDHDDDPTFEGAIQECRQRLVNAGYEPTAVRFCVNQIGGDGGSTRFLDALRSNASIQDVVYCTTERLDLKFRQFRENGRLLDEWLLHMLSNPIMHRVGN